MIPERARDWISASLAMAPRLWWGMGDVEADLAAGEARLWLGERSCVVTRVRPGVNGEQLLEIWIAGGELAELKAALPRIEDWGRSVGCTQAMIDGRPGWVRELKADGYEPFTVSIRKFLTW